ncbi:hypothetical protein BVI1335_1590017 [Burkholderia vietnamiensis]|nr:hypothetical protein BVI1335_1590017 [Burkholderia vietnamiensis]
MKFRRRFRWLTRSTIAWLACFDRAASGIPLRRKQTDCGTEDRGTPEHREYQRYFALEVINDTRG